MSENESLEQLKASRKGFYQFTKGEKIRAVLEGLRIRFFPRRILIAGPYAGEFGHELMDWQPWVSAQIARHEKVYVITYPGRDYLYPGCEVHYHDITLETAGYKHGWLSPDQMADMARQFAAKHGLKDYDLLNASHICTSYHQRFVLPAKYELLGKDEPTEAPRDVAFHFRNVKKAGPDQTRNYPLEQCDQVLELCRARGVTFFCVGHPRYSYCPAGVEDRRSEDLATSVRAIRSARILAGELSGPMHLAQLAGTSILIWADGQWRLDNCERWNVFRVPTYVVANDTHRPAPARVAEKVAEALADLRRRTDDFKKPAWTLPG